MRTTFLSVAALAATASLAAWGSASSGSSPSTPVPSKPAAAPVAVQQPTLDADAVATVLDGATQVTTTGTFELDDELRQVLGSCRGVLRGAFSVLRGAAELRGQETATDDVAIGRFAGSWTVLARFEGRAPRDVLDRASASTRSRCAGGSGRSVTRIAGRRTELLHLEDRRRAIALTAATVTRGPRLGVVVTMVNAPGRTTRPTSAERAVLAAGLARLERAMS